MLATALAEKFPETRRVNADTTPDQIRLPK